MQETITINGGSHRYLGELDEFKNGLPHGVVNKTKTDVGGTFVAATCDSNYIIVCPFIDLVKSIASDKNVKERGIEIFQCYGEKDIKEGLFLEYCKRNAGKPLKVAVTYDSLPKLLRWMDYKTDGWKLLVDEYHMILSDYDFRENAIEGLMKDLKRFNHCTFLSATPIDDDLEISYLKDLPHYRITWDNIQKIKVQRIPVPNMVQGVARVVKYFLEKGLHVTDVGGKKENVDELFIFMNSVTRIKQICDTLELDNDLVKICCADRKRNKRLIGNYEIESINNPNKKINFFTRKSFQGCNLFSNSGLIIVASDGGKECTLVDISTAMEQIAGRLRENEHYHNRFRNQIIHLYSTKNHVPTEEEFEAEIKDKEETAKLNLSHYNKGTDDEKKAFIKNFKFETSLLSEENGVLVYNELKHKAFIFNQKLKMSYKDGMTIRACYDKSDKLVTDDELDGKCLAMEMKKAITVSYCQLLQDYLDTRDPDYEREYPEFRRIAKYLTQKEMNSCKWNKYTMIKMAEDKMIMEKAFMSIYENGKFFTNAELKKILQQEFNRLGIKITAKATLIKECTLYEVTGTKKNGKAGYLLGKRKLDFTI